MSIAASFLTVAFLTGASACAPVTVHPGMTDGSAATAVARCHIVNASADKRCTPGAFNPNVTQETIRTTVCVPGWTAGIRPPSSYTNRLKIQQMRDYGETGPPSAYEEDHLISLSMGGSPTDPRNLFPEPWLDAHRKDTLEAKLHRDGSAGQTTLKQAQDQLLAEWSQH